MKQDVREFKQLAFTVVWHEMARASENAYLCL